MQAVREKYEAVDREIRRLEHTGIPGSEGLNRLLAERGSAPSPTAHGSLTCCGGPR